MGSIRQPVVDGDDATVEAPEILDLVELDVDIGVAVRIIRLDIGHSHRHARAHHDNHESESIGEHYRAKVCPARELRAPGAPHFALRSVAPHGLDDLASARNLYREPSSQKNQAKGTAGERHADILDPEALALRGSERTKYRATVSFFKVRMLVRTEVFWEWSKVKESACINWSG